MNTISSRMHSAAHVTSPQLLDRPTFNAKQIMDSIDVTAPVTANGNTLQAAISEVDQSVASGDAPTILASVLRMEQQLRSYYHYTGTLVGQASGTVNLSA